MSPDTIPYGQANPAGTQSAHLVRDLKLGGRSKLTIGRANDNDLPISHPSVSQYHAQIIWNQPAGVYLIEDLKSLNSTFVNGKRVIRPIILRKGDTVQIGPVQLAYQPEGIKAQDQSRNIGLTASNLQKVVAKNKNLLQNVGLAIQPGELVAIVGASGSGKSTLLNVLSGFKPASSGNVLLNGSDLYANYDAFRTQIGYVPQSNIIHMELTVYEALTYAAKLRLPPDTKAEEREKRIDEVLKTLHIDHRKDTPVNKLSGGEQKRVSIGVEYLTQPGLFFLDEATSGLDPGTETEIMALLRNLADKGHTVLIVTHATKNITKCHKILFMDRGYLVYFGSPKEALTYFRVNDFDEIYTVIKNLKPAEAAASFKRSSEYRKYIEPYARTMHSGNVHPSHNRASGNIASVSSISQFKVLSQRNINILKRDNKSLILMLLIAPLIGLMFFLFWRWGLFDAQTGNARFAITNIFMISMVCCLVGALSSMREIVKEAEIFKRERMVFLKIVPYVFSKVWVAILLSAYSALVFLIFMELAGGWPPLVKVPDVYLTMAVAILGGSMLGLLISAVSDNQNITPLLLVLILVPQLLFGGIIPAKQIGIPGKALGYVTTTKWTFESLIRISGMGDDIIADPYWSSNGQTVNSGKDTCPCRGENIFRSCNFPGIRQYYVKEIDLPEPKKPEFEEKKIEKPGDFPAPPVTPSGDYQGGSWQKDIKKWTDLDMKKWGDKVDKYQKDMESYKSDFTEYRDNKITSWQRDYEKWKEQRSKAIGEAEGIIRAINDDYGDAFKCSAVINWMVLTAMMVLLFGLVLLSLVIRD